MEGAIPISRYEAVLEGGEVVYYAIPKDKKKDRIRMPAAYKDMYTEEYLAVAPRTLERPELFELGEGEHWIPIRTS